MKGLCRLIAILAGVCLSGCMTTASIPGDKDLVRRLRLGETITVYTTDESVTTMFVGKVTEKELIGSRTAPPYRSVTIPRESIKEVHAERVHAGKTVGAIVLGTILTPVVIVFCATDSNGCLNDFQDMGIDRLLSRQPKNSL